MLQIADIEEMNKYLSINLFNKSLLTWEATINRFQGFMCILIAWIFLIFTNFFILQIMFLWWVQAVMLNNEKYIKENWNCTQTKLCEVTKYRLPVIWKRQNWWHQCNNNNLLYLVREFIVRLFEIPYRVEPLVGPISHSRTPQHATI